MNTHAGRKLNRPTGARMGMLRTQAASLLKHEKIQTTFAKAKEVSRYAEGLVAQAKRKTLTAQRAINAELVDRETRKKLYDVLVPRYEKRAGGCTRVVRTGQRKGDGAEMALVMMVS